MVEYGKTLEAIPHFPSYYNILEKITPTQDKAIASRCAFIYRENIVFQFSKHGICIIEEYNLNPIGNGGYNNHFRVYWLILKFNNINIAEIITFDIN